MVFFLAQEPAKRDNLRLDSLNLKSRVTTKQLLRMSKVQVQHFLSEELGLEYPGALYKYVMAIRHKAQNRLNYRMKRRKSRSV